jgi:hypothetical protein
MSRQTFVSNTFFVNASEETARLIILSLPNKTNEISFVSENNKLNFTRFNHQAQNQENYQVDVSLLPMNNEYTQVNIHVGFVDGHSFSNNNTIKQVLVQFEYSIQAALRGDAAFFQPPVLEERNSLSVLPFFAMIANFVANVFMWKKV